MTKACDNLDNEGKSDVVLKTFGADFDLGAAAAAFLVSAAAAFFDSAAAAFFASAAAAFFVSAGASLAALAGFFVFLASASTTSLATLPFRTAALMTGEATALVAALALTTLEADFFFTGSTAFSTVAGVVCWSEPNKKNHHRSRHRSKRRRRRPRDRLTFFLAMVSGSRRIGGCVSVRRRLAWLGSLCGWPATGFSVGFFRVPVAFDGGGGGANRRQRLRRRRWQSWPLQLHAAKNWRRAALPSRWIKGTSDVKTPSSLQRNLFLRRNIHKSCW